MNRPLHDILRDDAFAVHASSVRPAWLFESGGPHLIFANAAGAVALGFATCREAAGTAVTGELAVQLSRSAATMSLGSAPRLQRLRGLGSAFGQSLTCICTRVRWGSGIALLVAATEPVGRTLTPAERARYLIEDSGAAAAFGTDGRLLYANAEAAPHTGVSASLADLADGIETLRIGAGADAMVLAFFPAHSHPITSAPYVSAAQPALLDLSPIAEAITAMAKVPPKQNGRGGKSGGNSGAETPPRTVAANGSSGGTSERRHPLRFFWETDAQNRFTINSDAFIALAGPRTAKLLGRFWGEISAKLALDPEGLVAQALVSRDTWSGIEVDWPTSGGEMVRVTLSGIPTFDHDRTFRGYRGLGAWQGKAKGADAGEAIEPAPLQAAEPVPPATRVPFARLDEASAKAPSPALAPPQDEAQSQTAGEAQPQTENVVPFRAANSDPKTGGLNPAERNAFRDLGSRLSARLKGADELARGLMEKADPHEEPPYVPPVQVAPPQPQALGQAQTLPELLPEDDDEVPVERPILDKLPLGVLIYHGSNFVYANAAFLEFAGHGSLPAFAQAGGLDSMFVEFDGDADAEGARRLRIAAGDKPAMEARLIPVSIDGENATALMLQPVAVQQPAESFTRAAELAALLDIAVDGVATIDRNGTIVSANAGAEKLFGYDSGALSGRPFGDLFAPESERHAKARLDRLCRGEAAADGDGRELIGRRRKGALISLQLMLGRADQTATRYHALFRDMTRWKDAEKEMTVARQQAEKASAAKSEFLAKISHEMRTPLNAIIGFSEVMMEERFGPVGNERYRDYLKDINTSGAHLVSLLNDLLDLSKIEAGKMELTFERVDLNEVTQQSVGIMQAQANRARVIIRTALSMNVAPIIADARSVRQIVLNLLSNSIKFTGAGGQVIVSTAANDRGDVILRVRDTGVGMSEKDIETALQPFRQLTTSPRADANGTGLGLPLTKALVEANRARFSIKSAVNAGTLVEIVFPAHRRVLAE